MHNFSYNLKENRIKKKKTQLEIGKELGIKQRTYCSYEKGEREPNIETLIKLAEYFGITVDVLIK